MNPLLECDVSEHRHQSADAAQLCRLRRNWYGVPRTALRRTSAEVALEKRRLAEARSKRKEFFARRRAVREVKP